MLNAKEAGKPKGLAEEMRNVIALAQNMVTLHERYLKEYGNTVSDWPIEVLGKYADDINKISGVK